ncbi:MAG: SGNH/GDSL hydrolase family protein [Pseudomonadota bacterium]|nr:SGNH/GDSL hydrolase family protein [Pseudomonadota bacterium]
MLLLAATAALLPLFAACDTNQAQSGSGQLSPAMIHDIQPLTQEELHTVASLKVAFGHQSVGANIIDGIRRIASRGGVRLNVSEGRHGFVGPAIHHFTIGENGNPAGKIQDFSDTMQSAMAGTADVAFMKLCYIDFGSGADPVATARRYTAAVEVLSATQPATIFVPMTAPLTTVQTGPKAWIKRLLGKSPAGEEENLLRAQFNAALREHYSGDARLFDLAAIESAHGAVSFIRDGRTFEALAPQLTDDGGHLNEEGQDRVATALLRHLANQPRR